jgi:hypothetical protein
MTKCTVINASAQGLRMNNAHTHWHEVNPIRCQAKDWKADMKKWNEEQAAFRKRQRLLKANGSRILPALY